MKKELKKTDFEVDIHALETEWVNQPKFFMRYALMAAEARRDHEEAKNRVKILEAELSLDVRRDPAKYGLSKTTEDSIKATVITDPTMVLAQKEIIASRHDMDVADAAVTAMEHRKKALEKEVDLYIAGYFSHPKVKEANKEKFDELRTKAIRQKGRRRDTNENTGE